MVPIERDRELESSQLKQQRALDGVMLWMAGAVYECQAVVDPESVFCNLLGVHLHNISTVRTLSKVPPLVPEGLYI